MISTYDGLFDYNKNILRYFSKNIEGYLPFNLGMDFSKIYYYFSSYQRLQRCW